MKLIVLHADKQEAFATNWYYEYDGDGQSFPKVLKIASLTCLYNISKNKLEMKLIFECR